jgi:hypothetical protein
MWIFSLKKFKELLKLVLNFLNNFKNHLPHINGVYVHDLLGNVIKYNVKHTLLVMISNCDHFSKQNTKSTRNLYKV